MRTLLTASILLCASVAGAQTPPLPSPPVTGHGLSTQVLFVGANRSQSRLTLSVSITNTADTPAYIAIVGPQPIALDDKGGRHYIREIAGIAKCSQLDNSWIDDCIKNNRNVLPGTTFTYLPTKVTALINIDFKAKDLQPGATVSFAMNAALARGQRPTNRRSDQQNIEYINIHLPLMAIH